MTLQPLHEDLYTLDPERFFVGSFLDAIKDGSEAAIRHILIEHSPGVFTFNMLKPAFCSMMLEEVQASPEFFFLALLKYLMDVQYTYGIFELFPCLGAGKSTWHGVLYTG